MRTPQLSSSGQFVGRVVGVVILAAYIFGLPAVVKPHWTSVVDALGGAKGMYTHGMLLLAVSLLVGWNLLFAVLYALELPAVERYRINSKPWPWKQSQEKRDQIIGMVWMSVGLTTLNVLIGYCLSFANYPLAVTLGFTTDVAAFPSAITVAWQILCFTLIEDTLFYWNHRLMHSIPVVYRNVHKLHHKYYYSLSIAAVSTHPVEFIIGNAIPFSVGPMLMGAHCFTLVSWTIYRFVETIANHSGYEFPFSPFGLLPFQGTAESHDLHHSSNTGNFASFYKTWDWLCDTEIRETKSSSDNLPEAAGKKSI